MSQQDQGSEATEQPSERQKQKARQKGQVSRSRDLMMALQLLAAFVLLGHLNDVSDVLVNMVTLGQVDDLMIATTSDDLSLLLTRLQGAFALLPRLLLTLLIVSVISATAGAWLSGPMIFSFSVMAPQARRIDPISGLKKIFSRQGLAEVIRALLKTLLLATTLYLLFRGFYGEIMALDAYPRPARAIIRALQIIWWSALSLSTMMLMMAIVDVFWQKHRTNKQQLLTRQQVKDNLKNEEGSPQTRQRVRNTQQKLATMMRQKMLDAVPDADLILSNPGHYAVALQYHSGSQRAPVLVARGVDHLAQLIISIGRSAGKPVLVQPLLTRALYYHTEPGREIAPDLYQAVARVMVYLYQLDRYRTRQSSYCPSVPNIQVPKKYQHFATGE